MKKSALLSLGDAHTGSKIALCPPEVELDDEDIYKANPLQRKMWRWWTGTCAPWWRGLAKGRSLVVDDGGDGIDGTNHHGSLQTFGDNTTAESLHAEMMAPIVNAADRLIFLRGTRAHVGSSSESDRRIASLMGTRAVWQYKGDIGGRYFDIRHAANTSRQAWNRGRSIMGILHHVKSEAQDKDERVPDVVIRHHVHLFDAVRWWHNDKSMLGILAPSLKACDEYGASMAWDAYDIGAVMVLLPEMEVHTCLFR